MPINKLPGVYYNEIVELELTGDGSKIPVFIGKTGNIGTSSYSVDGTSILKFNKWEDVNKATSSGGIGVYTEGTTNKLLATLKNFFEEAKVTNNDDIGVPYIYVIDVGDGTSSNSWLTALATAKTKPDINIEVYVGSELISSGTTASTQKAFIIAAHTSLMTECENLQLRNAYYSLADNSTDSDLTTFLNDSTVKLSRMGLCEPLLFGKTIARICVTPYNMEPGYYSYRSVDIGTFKDRTPIEAKALQDAGVIFNRDEKTSSTFYPKINLCVVTNFSLNPRPADSLFHYRFICDELLKKVFDVCYPQIKNNETVSNFAYLQTRIDKLIDEEVSSGNIIGYNSDNNTGTYLKLEESNYNPYDAIIVGQIQCTNSTIALQIEAEIKTASLVIN